MLAQTNPSRDDEHTVVRISLSPLPVSSTNASLNAGTKHTVVQPLVTTAPMAIQMPTPMAMSRSELFEQRGEITKGDKSKSKSKKVTAPRSRLQTAIMSVVLYGTVVGVGCAVILAAHGDLSFNDIEYYAAAGVHGAESSLHRGKASAQQRDMPWTPIPENMPRWSPEEAKAPPPAPTFTEPSAMSAAPIATPVAPIAMPAPKATVKKSKTKKHAT